MTLNITATTLRYVCQVSDRRLCRIVRDGTTELYTDQANKSTILQCKDARMAVTYHGIGEARGIRTDAWLVDVLKKSSPVMNPIKKVLEEFREQSSEWMDNLRHNSQGNDADYRHTFIFAGWVLNNPIIFYVSNYENLKTREETSYPWLEFKGTFSRPILGSTNPCSLHAGGFHTALRKADIELLKKVIQKPGAQPKDVINIMVRAIQYVAKSSEYVSENCISTLLLPGQPGVECDYHSPLGTSASYMPNIVGKFSMTDIWIFAGEGTPPWHIRKAIPHQLTKAKIIKELNNLPAGYKTGDILPQVLDPQVEKFLRALPHGINIKEIEDAL